MLRRHLFAAAPIVVAALSGGCSRDSAPAAQGSAPPPLPSAAPSGQAAVCASGGGSVGDAATAAFFPRVVGGYCLDPNGETRVFGKGGKYTMDQVCTDCFDGECEVYRRYGLERVVHLRYVDGAGSPGSVEVYLSAFATPEGAYGMFTKRVVADGDPAEGTPRALAAGGAAAVGTGRGYVWKGSYLAELQYANEDDTPAKMKATSDRLLPALAQDLGAKLPGAAALPPAAARLPEGDRIPMGIAYATRDLLGVDGAGPGAVGYYKAGDKRWRSAVAVRDDADQAKDVWKSFSKLRGASEEKGLGEAAVRVVLGDKEGPRLEWLVARAGKQVVAVGDEEHALRGASPAEREKVCLSRDEKVARLKALLK